MVKDEHSPTRTHPDLWNQAADREPDAKSETSPALGGFPGDRYDPTEMLGTGGMAEVWLARDTSLQRDVAVKLMKAQFLDDPDLVERFRREGVAAASINHPNTVRIYDVGTGGGVGYLVMEHVPGGTLTERVRGSGPLDVGPWIRVAREVLGALIAIHEAGILHRDIKPSNILFDHRSSAKVADFGIAHLDDARGLTGSMVVGTPTYLSPEVLQGELATAQSDLFALGRTLIFAATGNAKNPALTGSFPPELHYWIDQLLAFDPSARFPDAATALEHLEAIDKGEPTPTPAITQPLRTVPIGPYTTANVPTLTDARPQSSSGLPWAVAGIAIGALVAVLALLLPGLRQVADSGSSDDKTSSSKADNPAAVATEAANTTAPTAATGGSTAEPSASQKAPVAAPSTETTEVIASPQPKTTAKPKKKVAKKPAVPSPASTASAETAPVLEAVPAAPSEPSLSLSHRAAKRALVGAPFKLNATTSSPTTEVVVMLRLGSRAWTSHSMSSSDGTNWNFSTAVDGKWLSGAAYYISAKSSGGSRVTSASAASPHTLTIR
jgi:serine/threonine protein kinase